MAGRDDWRWDEAREVSDGEEIAALLALSADPVEPDPALRERVMQSIAAAPQARRGAARHRWRLLATAAASAALAAGVTYALLARVPQVPDGTPAPQAPALEEAIAAAEDAEARADELEAMLDEQDAELLELERALDEARDALAVLSAERVERLDLRSAGSLEAKARVYWDWDDYSCYFVARGLPSAAERFVYVLWLTTDEGATLRAGSFTAEGSGPATFYAKLPRDIGRVVRAVVTREAEPPGDAPEGDVLLTGGA